MGIKMELGEADKQAQSAKEVMAERIAAYNQLLGAIDLLLAADDLQGQAYDNIKNYAEGKLRPLALGAQLLAQGVGPATEKSPTDFRSQVGGESLDEDELVKEIEAYNQTIDVAEEYQAILKKSNALAVADPSGGQAALAAVAAQIDGLTAERDALQTKLDKLRAWAAGTATVCNEVHPLEAAVKQGVAEISQDMASFSGSFPTLQKGQSPDWVKTINKYLEAEELSADYKVVLSKIANGQELSENDLLVITKFGQQHPKEELPSEIKTLLSQPQYKEVRTLFKETKKIEKAALVLYLGSKITKDSRGNLILQHATTKLGKQLEKAFGLDKYRSQNSINRGRNYSKITRGVSNKSGKVTNGQYTGLMDDFHVDYGNQLATGRTTLSNLKNTVVNGVKNSAKSGVQSGLTAGLTDIIGYSKGKGFSLKDGFKQAGKIRKGFAIANVVFSAWDVYDGIEETKKIGIQQGIKAGSINDYANQAGGITVDVAKNAGIVAASSAAAAASAAAVGTVIAGAPVIATVGAAVVAGYVVAKTLNKIDETFKISKNIKKWWAGLMKG